MKRRLILALLLVIIVSAAGTATWWLSPGSPDGAPAKGRGVFSLVRPVFAQQGSFLDQEAGMAAYANVGSSINLGNARRAFKVVEAEEAGFLIGVVDVIVPTPSQQKQPHVFVHKDGWVVAYFLRDESVGYVWPFGQNIKPPESVLLTALNQVAGVSGFSLSAVDYYNFKFPSANRVTVVNASSNTVDFSFQVPTAFQVFEAAGTYYSGRPRVNDFTSGIRKGEFQSRTGALILVYREP